jgi:hypothetical protein
MKDRLNDFKNKLPDELKRFNFLAWLGLLVLFIGIFILDAGFMAGGVFLILMGLVSVYRKEAKNSIEVQNGK